MPALEVQDLNQFAVLYAHDGTSFDDYGEPKVDARVEIKVRWETGKREAIDAQGNTIAIESLAVVDRVIGVGSTLWLGKLDDIPSPVTDLRVVVEYIETPDIKAREFRRVILMQKLSDEVPALT